MTRKTGWEKSTDGPDWIDVEMLMRALEGLHGGAVAVIISPDGIGSTGGVDVAASSLFDVVPGAGSPASVIVHKRWPCATHKSLAAHAFSLLADLDFEISKAYKAIPVWE